MVGALQSGQMYAIDIAYVNEPTDTMPASNNKRFQVFVMYPSEVLGSACCSKLASCPWVHLLVSCPRLVFPAQHKVKAETNNELRVIKSDAKARACLACVNYFIRPCRGALVDLLLLSKNYVHGEGNKTRLRTSFRALFRLTIVHGVFFFQSPVH